MPQEKKYQVESNYALVNRNSILTDFPVIANLSAASIILGGFPRSSLTMPYFFIALVLYRFGTVCRQRLPE